MTNSSNRANLRASIILAALSWVEATSCWKRHWNWPNDYCALTTSCEKWEIEADYSQSWELCCANHCAGTGVTSNDEEVDIWHHISDASHGTSQQKQKKKNKKSKKKQKRKKNKKKNKKNQQESNQNDPTSTDGNSDNINSDTIDSNSDTIDNSNSDTIDNSNSDSKNKRMVAYVENWKACPTDAQLDEYTHIIFAFTVTYTWAWSGNDCSDQCSLYEPSACGGESIQAFLARAHKHNVKVLLSLGGAGMGGLWDLSKNRCWDACWDMPSGLAAQTAEQVTHFGFDGVDIDYEYLVETEQQQKFVVDLTLELRRLLPAGALLTHAPMDYTLNKGEVYYQLLSEMGSSLDFLMPQYYNGYINVIASDADVDKAMTHFGDLVEAMGGDQSKVVFGFCLNDCGSFNAGKARAATVAEILKQDFPDHGGVFFWASSGDPNGSWSSHVNMHQ